MVKRWINTRIRDININGMGGVRRAVGDVYNKVAKDALLRLRPDFGTPVFERDWDVLIIIDGCRYDTFCEVVDDYEYVKDHEPVMSAGGSSKMWMRENFIDEYYHQMRKTAHITGNPFSAEMLDASDWAYLEEVWRYRWDEELETLPARPLSDRLIDVWRSRSPDRLLVHYMQPHAAFIPHPEFKQYEDEFERSIWRSVLRGRVSRKDVIDAYRENLRYIMDELRLVANNLDAKKVVVSSDHGNAVGEWGFYGHNGAPTKVIREVPWATLDTRDEKSYEPSLSPPESIIDDVSVESRLADLGYIEGDRGEAGSRVMDETTL